MAEKNNKKNLENKLRELKTEREDDESLIAEELLLISDMSGVYLLIPHQKVSVQIAKRKNHSQYEKNAPGSPKAVIHNQKIYEAAKYFPRNEKREDNQEFHSFICETVEHPILNLINYKPAKDEPQSFLRRILPGWLGGSTGSAKNSTGFFYRPGETFGLISLDNTLLDYGSLGSKLYGIFETLSCPTGEESPVAVREGPITNMFLHDGKVYDLSGGFLFETFKERFGKEDGISVKGFSTHDACSYKGKIYVCGRFDNEALLFGELEEMLRTRRPIKIIEEGKSESELRSKYYIPIYNLNNLRFVQHQDRLFIGIQHKIPSPHLNRFAYSFYDCFSDYKTGDMRNKLDYSTHPLAAKYMGAVPIGMGSFEVLMQNETIFEDIARPSMIDELNKKIDKIYSEQGVKMLDEDPSLLKNRQKANELFSYLKRMKSELIGRYSYFEIGPSDIPLSDLEKRFAVYEKMVNK